jgi:hypothetical protein
MNGIADLIASARKPILLTSVVLALSTAACTRDHALGSVDGSGGNGSGGSGSGGSGSGGSGSGGNGGGGNSACCPPDTTLACPGYHPGGLPRFGVCPVIERMYPSTFELQLDSDGCPVIVATGAYAACNPPPLGTGGGDGGSDVAPAMCVRDGVSYNVGDIIPSWSASCGLQSCACLEGGVIGRCTGACPPPDASRTEVAHITVSRSTNTPAIDVVVYSDASAVRTIGGDAGASTVTPRVFDAASADVDSFILDLTAAGDLGAIGDKTGQRCPKSASSGTVTTITAYGTTSGDIECLTSAGRAEVALAHDTLVLTGTEGASYDTDRDACLATGGQLSTGLCCTATEGPLSFPDSCAPGACGCAPANGRGISTCICGTGTCFHSGAGCVGLPLVCTVGADQSCNDNPALSSVHGQCVTGGRCVCGTYGFAPSGKCL